MKCAGKRFLELSGCSHAAEYPRSQFGLDINFWVSNDLIDWNRHSDYVPDLKHVPDYPKAMARIGAPKLFFDRASSQYLLTWHTTHDLGKTDLPEPY